MKTLSLSRFISSCAFLVIAALLVFYFVSFVLSNVEVANIPVPAGLEIAKNEQEDLGPRIRYLIHAEGDVSIEDMINYYTSVLPDHGWTIEEEGESYLVATRAGGRARITLHREKHRLLVIINASVKK